MIPVNRPIVTDAEANAAKRAVSVAEISGTSSIVNATENYLSEFLGVKYVILTSSGTAAIDVAVGNAKQEKNSNAVVPNLTIISSVNELIRRNYEIRLVDSNIESWVSDSSKLASQVDANTSIVMPTHLYGISIDIRELRREIDNEHTLIIEDAAENFGTRDSNGSFYGTLGDIGITSFYVNKNITSGEGGAIFTDNQTYAKEARELRNLGFSNELPRFVHNKIGWNYRMSGINASIIPPQMERLTEILSRRKEIGKRYLDNLSSHPWLSFQPQELNGEQNFNWVFPILLDQEVNVSAQVLQDYLAKNHVESRRLFCPMHLQPVLKGYTRLKVCGKMPNSTRLWEKGLYLPSGLGNTNEEIDYTSEMMWRAIKDLQ